MAQPGDRGAATELIAAISHDAQSHEARHDAKQHLGKTPEQAVDEAVAQLGPVVAALAKLPLEEAVEVRSWLVDIAPRWAMRRRGRASASRRPSTGSASPSAGPRRTTDRAEWSRVIRPLPVAGECRPAARPWRPCRPTRGGALRARRGARGTTRATRPPSRRNATRPSRSSVAPGSSSAYRHTRSPNTSSGIATAAATATAGCSATSASTAGALMFLPPRMMMSDVRPTTRRYPSASTVQRSPMRIQPSAVNSSSLAAIVVEVAQTGRRSPADGVPGRVRGRDVGAGVVEQPDVHVDDHAAGGLQPVVAVVAHRSCGSARRSRWIRRTAAPARR